MDLQNVLPIQQSNNHGQTGDDQIVHSVTAQLPGFENGVLVQATGRRDVIIQTLKHFLLFQIYTICIHGLLYVTVIKSSFLLKITIKSVVIIDL